jgi:hypothetical protein
MIIRRNNARFAIELDTDVCDPYTNANLTLTLQLGFSQINPAGGAATGTYNDYGDATETARRIIRWDAASWQAWKANFAASAQDYWNGRFWLINNMAETRCDRFGLMFNARGRSYAANIYCRMRIRYADGRNAGDNHHIDVVRLAPGESFFGSHSTLYDSRDTMRVRKADDSRGRPIMQRAHVHEVGHLLGLDHVDVGQPHCPVGGDTNRQACYGHDDASLNAVMGSGMTLTPECALPWRNAIISITGFGASTNSTDWAPRTERHYPRSIEEVQRRVQVTTRVRR